MTSQPRLLVAIPVFPLPDFYLYPGVVAPLHVFETRYRQMVEDMLDGPGRMVLAPYAAGTARDERGPRLPDMGTLVEIVQHERLEDGRWVLVVAALSRAAIAETGSDRLYRKVDAEMLPEPEVNGAAAGALRPRLLAALHARAAGEWEAPDGTALGRLADLLLHALDLDVDRKERSYHETDPVARAALALAWHDLAARNAIGDADERAS
ncbi:MAG TPA: LON peptidase substrate-binding domain-containing protein [Candidatus Krumholzibacteria bacterium]|nr:LON peptidase substrate-binding domain-containing protein [Candidatus Krumholzibacteria bacterium]